MKIYTLGFTKKSAREFFEILKDNNIEQIVDVRLNNTSQLAGFTKKKDLEFFLEEMGSIDYIHLDILAPDKELRKIKDWEEYSQKYLELIEKRDILNVINTDIFQKRSCLLCSEPSAEDCHRSILADYIKKHWENVKVVHL